MAPALHKESSMTLAILLLGLSLSGPPGLRVEADTAKPKPPVARPAPPPPPPSSLKPEPKPAKKPVGEPVLKRRRPPM